MPSLHVNPFAPNTELEPADDFFVQMAEANRETTIVSEARRAVYFKDKHGLRPTRRRQWCHLFGEGTDLDHVVAFLTRHRDPHRIITANDPLVALDAATELVAAGHVEDIDLALQIITV